MSDFRPSGEVLCMGSIHMDLVMFVDHLPEPGETVLTDNFNTYPGGKGGNQAAAASLLGGKVVFLGKLGDDAFSQQLIDSLARKGVGVEHILREKSATAGIAMIWVDKRGQNSICFTPGANVKLVPEDVKSRKDLFQEGRILLISMEIRPDTVYEAVRIAEKSGMFVILDPAPAPKNIPRDVPGCVDIVKPNEVEAWGITGVKVTDLPTAETALKKMVAAGFSCPIVTLGEKGAVASVRGTLHRIEPLPVNVVDATAAGDVFSGALAASIASGRDVLDAIGFANAAAALSTTVRGAQTSVPSLEQVEAFCKKK